MLYRTVDIIHGGDEGLHSLMAADYESLRYVRTFTVTNAELMDEGDLDVSEPGSALFRLLERLPQNCLEEFQSISIACSQLRCVLTYITA